MAEVVEALEHPDAEVEPVGVLGVQLPQDVDLQLGGLPVLVDVLNDLEREVGAPVAQVPDLGHLAEGALPEGADNLIPIQENITG